MARSDYVKVFRGIHRAALPEADAPKREDWGGLTKGYAERAYIGQREDDGDYEFGAGRHWTPKFDTAAKFAKENGFNSWYDLDKSHTQGLVLEGYVHKRHIVDRRTGEGRYLTAKYDIWPGNKTEGERTIREGSPIIITKMHHVGQQFANPLTFEKEFPWRGRA